MKFVFLRNIKLADKLEAIDFQADAFYFHLWLPRCHCEPFAPCHSERSEESHDAQDRLREAISNEFPSLRDSKIKNSSSFPEIVTSHETQEQTSKVSLPGYPGDEERDEEEDQDCYPEWHGDRDGKYEDRRSGDHYGQCSSEGIDAS